MRLGMHSRMGMRPRGTAALPATRFPRGSAASPAIYFDGDGDTGIYSPGANQVAMAAGSAGPLSVSQFLVNLNTSHVQTGGVLTPMILTVAAIGAGPHNDYTPAGISATYQAIAQDVSAAAVINGLIALSSGSGDWRGLFINDSTVAARTITFAHENAGSLAANRFRCPNLANFVLSPGEACWLWYRNAISRWQIIGTT